VDSLVRVGAGGTPHNEAALMEVMDKKSIAAEKSKSEIVLKFFRKRVIGLVLEYSE
jgi:hypothetical protein